MIVRDPTWKERNGHDENPQGDPGIARPVPGAPIGIIDGGERGDGTGGVRHRSIVEDHGDSRESDTPRPAGGRPGDRRHPRRHQGRVRCGRAVRPRRTRRPREGRGMEQSGVHLPDERQHRLADRRRIHRLRPCFQDPEERRGDHEGEIHPGGRCGGRGRPGGTGGEGRHRHRAEGGDLLLLPEPWALRRHLPGGILPAGGRQEQCRLLRKGRDPSLRDPLGEGRQDALRGGKAEKIAGKACPGGREIKAGDPAVPADVSLTDFFRIRTGTPR